jgi:hypothetical protein
MLNPEQTRKRGRLRRTFMALLNVSVYCCGLGGAALAIWAVLPMPDVPEVRAKLKWLAAHGSEYDTVFIGSSRVRRQISPSVFDSRMAEHGIPTRSYNLGIDAMTFPELGYVLERFLEHKPPGLRFVIADLNALRRKLGAANEAESLRAVYWHDLRHTAQVCEAIWGDAASGTQPWSEALPLMQGHLALMVRQYSNLGRGAGVSSLDGKGGSANGEAGEKEPRFLPGGQSNSAGRTSKL